MTMSKITIVDPITGDFTRDVSPHVVSSAEDRIVFNAPNTYARDVAFWLSPATFQRFTAMTQIAAEYGYAFVLTDAGRSVEQQVAAIVNKPMLAARRSRHLTGAAVDGWFWPLTTRVPKGADGDVSAQTSLFFSAGEPAGFTRTRADEPWHLEDTSQPAGVLKRLPDGRWSMEQVGTAPSPLTSGTSPARQLGRSLTRLGRSALDKFFSNYSLSLSIGPATVTVQRKECECNQSIRTSPTQMVHLFRG